MAKIIDFNTAKRKLYQPKLNELEHLQQISRSLNSDAALSHYCGLPGGSKEEAEKLDHLLEAFFSNPCLRNLDLTPTGTDNSKTD